MDSRRNVLTLAIGAVILSACGTTPQRPTDAAEPKPAPQQVVGEGGQAAEPAPTHSAIALLEGPSSGKVGDLLRFDASESRALHGRLVGYDWDFGDGKISSSTSPMAIHRYSQPGSYTVSMTARSDTDRATVSQRLTIEPQAVVQSPPVQSPPAQPPAVRPPPTAAPAKTGDHEIFFERNAYVVSPALFEEMERVLEHLQRNQDLEVKIVGLSELDEQSGLGRKRARTVGAWLVNYGVSVDRIYYGSGLGDRSVRITFK